MNASSNTNGQLGTALITGASTGIGAVYADRLAKRGYDLILVARDKQRLDELAAKLRQATGRKVETLRADLIQKPDLLAVTDRLATDPAITMLVNNAGMAVNGLVVGGDADLHETMILLNVVAVTRLAHAAANAFVQHKRGTILNIASVLALAPEAFNGVYSGTKAFVLNLTQAIAAETASAGVRVQAVLPGATRTEIWERAGRSIDSLPAEMLMEAGDMVDASLAGLDQGELVTIPSLADPALWEAFSAARAALGPHLSKNRSASRYHAAQPVNA
jgi:short-subunit dehydrogenase